MARMGRITVEGRRRLNAWRSPAFQARVARLIAQGDVITAAAESLVKVRAMIEAMSNVARGWQRVYNAGHPAKNRVLLKYVMAMHCVNCYRAIELRIQSSLV